MVTVQDKHNGSQQLMHPLQSEIDGDRFRERKMQEGKGEREKIWFICGQSFFNSDARGF